MALKHAALATTPVTLTPGDAFVVEPGFTRTGKIEAPVRKHFCIKLK